MPLRLEEKKAVVSEVNTVAAQALSCVGAAYRGLTVEQLDGLRKQARASNVYVKVVKNTLARRAVEGTDFECLKPALKGPLVLAFSNEDPGAAARIFRDFAKANEKLEVMAVAIGGQLLPASDLGRVASLPTREEALTQLAVVCQAPITKFVRTLAEPHARMVRAFGAVRDQKQAA